MCGPGKTATSSQGQSGSTTGSPMGMAMANDAWTQAFNASQAPFQTYGGEFVAPVNQQQQTGITGINQAAGTYAPYGGAALSSLSPYFGAATGTLGQGLSSGQGLTGAGVGLTAGNASLNPNSVQQWMSPYVQNVVQATENQQQQQNQIQQSQLEGSAIQSGAFGGDRSGVAAANLAYQQNLANQPVIANLYNQGYSQALGEANTQQQTGLQAGAQLGSLGNQLFNQGLSGSQQYQNLGTGLSSAYSGLGTTAQQNQLTAANAQLGAGTLQQQTQQAQDQALYNQFLQQQAYPFQTSQFLTNTVQGLAPIYGTQSQSTGTATQPMSFFRRGGRVGPMVDLEMGDDGVYRVAKAGGGGLSDDALANLIAAHGQMYAPRAPAAADQGPFGTGLSSRPTQLPTVQLPNMSTNRNSNTGVGHDIDVLNRTADFGKNLAGIYSLGKEAAVGTPSSTVNGKAAPASGGLFGYGGKWGATNPANPPGGGGISSAPLPAPTGNGVTLDVNGAPVPTLPGGTLISDDNYARGGRTGFAYGGIPYAGGITDPYIPPDLGEPTDISRPFEALNGQGGLSNGSGGGGGGGQKSSGLGSALGDITKIAGMVLPFLAKGGRIHKEGGGGLSDPAATPDDDLFPKMLVAESGNQHFNPKTGQPTTSPKGAIGVAQIMPGTAPEAAKLAGVEWDPELFNRGRTGDPTKDKEAEDYNRKLGQAYYNEQKRVFGDPVVATAAYNAGPQATRDAQARAQKQGGSYLDYLPKETQNYVSSLMPGRGDPSTIAGSFVPSALSGASSTGSAPGAQPSWWDRESGGLSGTERGVISLLSGLGGMASSPSRFFGGALLSGVGAGANTYGQLAQRGKALDIQQQQANTSQGQLGVAQMGKSIELYNQLRVLAGGYTRTGQPVPQWITDQLGAIGRNLYGQSPMPGGVTPVSGGGLSSGAAPSAAPTPMPTQTAPLPPPVKTAPLPAPSSPPTAAEPSVAPPPAINIGDPTFRKALGPDRDPMSLRERARDTASFGDTAGSEKLMERADKLEAEYRSTGKATGEDGKVIDVPGFAESQASVGRVEPNQKWLDEQGTQALQRSQAREQLDVIKGILENYESGSLAGMKAQAQALAKGLGVSIPDTATMNAAAYEKFLKATLRNVFSDVKDMGGRPLVSEIQGFEKATASPELQPSANKEILAQLYARLNQLDKYYGDTASEMSKNKALDRGSYTNQWLKQKENGIAPMVDDVKRDLAVRGATPPNVKGMQEGHAYIIEPGQFPDVTQGGKYRLGRNAQGQLGLMKVQ